MHSLGHRVSQQSDRLPAAAVLDLLPLETGRQVTLWE